MTEYTSRMRTVYFVRPFGERGPIKIGCSNNAERRLGQLQLEYGKPLEIIAAVPGSMDDERRVHSMFWHDHIAREWFKWSGSLQALADLAARRPLRFNMLPPTQVRAMPWRRRKTAA